MKGRVVAFSAGLLFAAGLVLAQMTDPRKVTGFLDVAGAWDPSLAFVMMGALVVATPLFRLVLRRPGPRFAARFHVPRHERIDAPLVVGAVLFGLGWGLSGYCPGPAVVSTMSLHSGALVFAGAMVVGMGLFELRRRIAR